MLEGTAVLKAPQGAGQVYGEDVCFRVGQVWAGADEGDNSKLRFVWGAEERQHRPWIRNGESKTSEWKSDCDEGEMVK